MKKPKKQKYGINQQITIRMTL
uniref:Uncharacterized protein n=1 Tax=Rhizophora mucronata TaxID=61149 RepID=A0A2P2Q1P2_RHIMU